MGYSVICVGTSSQTPGEKDRFIRQVLCQTLKIRTRGKNYTIYCPHEAYSQVKGETANDYKNEWFKPKCILHEANI